MTKVSVILPSFNVSEYIKECIESVISQTLGDMEIICVDAGSTDGTIEILREYSLRNKNIKLLLSDKKSYGYQVNMGLKIAEGEYIGFVETDDFIVSEMYEKLYYYAKRMNADVVKCPYIEYLNKQYYVPCYYMEKLNKALPHDRCFSSKEYGYLLAYHASVWAGIYKRDYLINNNLYFVEAPGAGYVDVGFRYDTLINSNKCCWYSEPLYFYRTSNENSSTNKFDLNTMICRWEEVHKKSLSIKEDFEKHYAPYLILDEYLNTLTYLSSIKVSRDEMLRIHKLFDDYDISVLNRSNVLSKRIRKNIIDFKNDKESYFAKSQLYVKNMMPLINLAKTIAPKGTKRRRLIKKYLLLQK